MAKKVSPRIEALRDIAEDLKDEGIDTRDNSNGEMWIVSSAVLECPEQRELNRELGIHAVNKKDNHLNLRK